MKIDREFYLKHKDNVSIASNVTGKRELLETGDDNEEEDDGVW